MQFKGGPELHNILEFTKGLKESQKERIENLDAFICPKCNHDIFETAVKLFKLSDDLIKQYGYKYQRAEVCICKKCGFIIEDDDLFDLKVDN